MDKIKYVTVETITEVPANERESHISDKPIESKEKIVKYMKKFPVEWFTSAPTVDVFTSEIVNEANNGRSDGVYEWYESEIYHFEKYNWKLNDDFIEYVLSKI